MQHTSIQTAAANYSYLRGLFLIPLGTLFILGALANWQVGPMGDLFPVAVVLGGIACLPINRYYNKNYGRLRPSARQQVREAIAVVLGLAVIGGGSALLRSQADWSLDLITITLAAVMLITYAIGVGLKAHHVIIWGSLLVAGALPVWTGDDPSNIGLVLSGVGFMVCGVFDHRLFVRTFGSPNALQRENTDVGA